MRSSPAPWYPAAEDVAHTESGDAFDVAVIEDKRGAVIAYVVVGEKGNAKNVPLITAAPDGLTAAYLALDALTALSDQAGDEAFWNKGGEGYEAAQALRDFIKQTTQREPSHRDSRTLQVRVKATGEIVTVRDYGDKIVPRYWTVGNYGYMADEVEIIP